MITRPRTGISGSRTTAFILGVAIGTISSSIACHGRFFVLGAMRLFLFLLSFEHFVLNASKPDTSPKFPGVIFVHSTFFKIVWSPFYIFKVLRTLTFKSPVTRRTRAPTSTSSRNGSLALFSFAGATGTAFYGLAATILFHIAATNLGLIQVGKWGWSRAFMGRVSFRRIVTI